MSRYIKKADIVLFVFLIVFGLALSWLSVAGTTPGKQVVVTVGGQFYGTYDLAQDQAIEIKQNDHTNKIIIKDRAVQMAYSDCHNQVCVNDGAIHDTGASIVCLPNRVMIELTGDGEDDLDGVSQ